MQFFVNDKKYDLNSSERPQQPARKEDWYTEPIAGKKKFINIHLDFTEKEFQWIRWGMIPQDMNDKWFVFWDGEYLHFHRSWTGHCIYQMKIQQDGKKYFTKGFWVTQDENILQTGTDEEEIENLLFLLGYGLIRDKRVMDKFLKKFKASHPAELWSKFGRLLF